MSRVLLEVRTENTAWMLEGPRGRALHAWFEEIKVPRQYDSAEGLWMVPRSRIADIVDSCQGTARSIYVFGAWS